jgi:alpha-1,6-mannosyltransferase
MLTCRIRWALGGAGLLAAAISLRWSGDVKSQAGWTVGVLLCSSLFYLISVKSVLTKGAGTIGPAGCVWIATVAVAARLIFLTQGPLLSEDLFRYRWEGRVQASGINPYFVTPVDPETAFLKDQTSPRIPGWNVRAGYGPLWEIIEQQVFRLAAWAEPRSVERQLLWMKLPSLVGDLSVLVLLLALLRSNALPWSRVIVWAWCPLTWIEFWGEGHMDSLLAALVVAALVAARRERWALAGVFLTAGGLIKWWPFLLLPIFALHAIRHWSGVRWRGLFAGLPLTALAVWPYATLSRELWSRNAAYMSGFLGGWRNNDSLFGVIWYLSGQNGDIAKLVSLVALGLLVLVACLQRAPLERVVLGFVAGMLLLSANVHPWYMAWLAPLLAVEPSLAGFAWVALMPLAYVVLDDYRVTGIWQGSTGWRWLIYTPVFAAWMLRRRISVVGKKEE